MIALWVVGGALVSAGLSYAVAWCTVAWIQRHCDCELCEHERELS